MSFEMAKECSRHLSHERGGVKRVPTSRRQRPWGADPTRTLEDVSGFEEVALCDFEHKHKYDSRRFAILGSF